MKKLISTKLITTNIGNQALSDELINLSISLGINIETKITGRPFGLDKYTITNLDASKLIDSFENLACDIAKTTYKFKESTHKWSETRYTKLLDVDGSVVKTESLRRYFRILRRLYLNLYPYSPVYKERLIFYKQASYYLYSAAGEVSQEEFFYRQLLDLRVAQILGVKVCPINQSVELPEGKYKSILGYVYSKCHKIVVRGVISKNELISMGVNSEIIQIAPDSAFRTVVTPSKRNDKISRVGINFTRKTYKSEIVDPFVQKLLTDGYEVEFITNDPFGDMEIAKILHNKFKIAINVKTLDYKSYVKFLQNFDLILSSRLHTNELALTGKIPVLPIEGNVHKTTEVFEHINYPIKVIDFRSSEYSSLLFQSFNLIKDDYIEIQNWIDNNINNISKAAEKNISSIFE